MNQTQRNILRKLERQCVQDLSAYELVNVLLGRFVLSNGCEFITTDQRDQIIEALQDKDT